MGLLSYWLSTCIRRPGLLYTSTCDFLQLTVLAVLLVGRKVKGEQQPTPKTRASSVGGRTPAQSHHHHHRKRPVRRRVLVMLQIHVQHITLTSSVHNSEIR